LTVKKEPVKPYGLKLFQESLNRMKLEEFRNFFFDLDGTIWRWDETVDGAQDMLKTLRDAEKNVYFHTDNTLLSRKGYARRLEKKGIQATEEEIITSGYVTAEILSDREILKVYAVGEQGLTEELTETGIKITEDADHAVLGLDRKINYQKMEKVRKRLSEGHKLFNCSSENLFRRENSKLHQGAIAESLSQFGDVKLTAKPSDAYRKVFKNYFSYFPGKSLFVGDRLADIQTGNRLGMKTAAVLTGDITEKKINHADEDAVPDYALTSLDKVRRRIL